MGYAYQKLTKKITKRKANGKSKGTRIAKSRKKRQRRK